MEISSTWIIGVNKPTAYIGRFHALNDCRINELFPRLQMQSQITRNNSNNSRNALPQLRIWICQAIRGDVSAGLEQFSPENTTYHTADE